MTGPAVPPGGEELREAIARVLWEAQVGCVVTPWDELSPLTPTRGVYRGYADAVLALPAVRDALAAQEKLRRVRELAARFPSDVSVIGAGRLRRALDGDS